MLSISNVRLFSVCTADRVRVADSAEMLHTTPDNTHTRASCGDVTAAASTSCNVTSAVVSTGPSTLPTQEDVIRKTEKITRKLQELFVLAQDGKHEL